MKPLLDDAALERLRTAVRDLRHHEGGPVPHRDLVAFGTSLGADVRAMLDLRATETLGVPLVVVVPAPAESSAFLVLSPREREVAGLIADGLTNKAIAHRLGLSPATVKDHVHHILGKTGLPNRAAVVAQLSRSIPSALF